jgi:adenylate cyclase, class 2
MSHMPVEREVKLRFPTADLARAAVVSAGAIPLRPRRLQEDCLLDTADARLRDRRSALRVRREDDRTILTFKGPVQPAAVKLREEVETSVADPAALLHVLRELGYEPWFRYEKYREEFTWPHAIVAVDETPIGTFVEIEGQEQAIADMTRALGLGTSDYVLESYRGLFQAECIRRGVPLTDMLFANV